MAATDKPVEIDSVSCEVCLKEIPLSEATVSEATDYFVHFCGLDCYEAWRRQAEQGNAPSASTNP